MKKGLGLKDWIDPFLAQPTEAPPVTTPKNRKLYVHHEKASAFIFTFVRKQNLHVHQAWSILT
jgi:hypothetical protein